MSTTCHTGTFRANKWLLAGAVNATAIGFQGAFAHLLLMRGSSAAWFLVAATLVHSVLALLAFTKLMGYVKELEQGLD